MCERCKFPDGIVVKPDGVHELDPCSYELSEVYKNVTVEILVCKKCGNVSIGWRKQPDTIEVDLDTW